MSIRHKHKNTYVAQWWLATVTTFKGCRSLQISGHINLQLCSLILFVSRCLHPSIGQTPISWSHTPQATPHRTPNTTQHTQHTTHHTPHITHHTTPHHTTPQLIGVARFGFCPTRFAGGFRPASSHGGLCVAAFAQTGFAWRVWLGRVSPGVFRPNRFRPGRRVLLGSLQSAGSLDPQQKPW